MEEINKKLDLILSSQVVIQAEVIRLNSKIDNLDEKFEKKFEQTNQRIDDLDEKVNLRIDNLNQKFEQRFDELEETLEKDRKDIAGIFNDIVKKIPA